MKPMASATRLRTYAVRILLVTVAAVLLVATCTKPRPRMMNPRQEKALAMWRERCKTAGVFIHRTVENVDGIFLLKIRDSNHVGDQFLLNDPYGRDFTGDAYIHSFLHGETPTNPDVKKYVTLSTGYKFVEAIDPTDGKRYRYTSSLQATSRADPNLPSVQRIIKNNPNYDPNNYEDVMSKTIASGDPPRYGVTFDDISTHAEREYWIAGSSLKVIDLESNDIIAERIGYMMDIDQGASSDGSSPWLSAAALACPEFQWNPVAQRTPAFPHQWRQTPRFVEKSLKPSPR